MPYSFVFTLIFAFSFRCLADARDPSANIRVTELGNGLKIVYAPSVTATTAQVKIRVDAGRWNEEKAGAAHLLEHYIFKDGKMERDMTYLEVIKENGGSGNAFVDDETTTFYATVPPAKANWLLGTFARMIVGKKFNEDEVQFAKKPVYLEIGQPNPFHYLRAAFDLILPEVDLFPDFWRSEFNIKRPAGQAVPDQISTASLRAADLEAYYRKFYHSKNMTVFVSGKFNEREIEKSAAALFTAMPSGETLGKKIALSARRGDYLRLSATPGTPDLSVGTKIADATLEETMAIYVYMEHLSFRLMKEIRNARGETYTARADVNLRRQNGYASIDMEAPPEAFNRNVNLVRDYIQRETRDSQISAEAFAEARTLYLKNYDLTDMDSSTMMYLAENAVEYRELYGEKVRTPFQIVSSMTLEDYKKSLKRIFASDMKLEKLEAPPYVWRYEEFLLLLVSAWGWAWLTRRLFASPFNHSDLRWVRKFRVPPLGLFYLPAYIVAAFATAVVASLFFNLWTQTAFLQSSVLVADYLPAVVMLGGLFIATQLCLGVIGHKLMVNGEDLVLKSAGYRSERIPLNQIELVTTLRAWILIFKPLLLAKLFLRFYMYDIFLWRRCLLLKTKSGKYFLLGVNKSEDARKDIEMFISSAATKENSHSKVA